MCSVMHAFMYSITCIQHTVYMCICISMSDLVVKSFLPFRVMTSRVLFAKRSGSFPEIHIFLMRKFFLLSKSHFLTKDFWIISFCSKIFKSLMYSVL